MSVRAARSRPSATARRSDPASNRSAVPPHVRDRVGAAVRHPLRAVLRRNRCTAWPYSSSAHGRECPSPPTRSPLAARLSVSTGSTTASTGQPWVADAGLDLPGRRCPHADLVRRAGPRGGGYGDQRTQRPARARPSRSAVNVVHQIAGVRRQRFTALAVSMLEPPRDGDERIQSPPARAAATASRNDRSVGSTCTPANVSTYTPRRAATPPRGPAHRGRYAGICHERTRPASRQLTSKATSSAAPTRTSVRARHRSTPSRYHVYFSS